MGGNDRGGVAPAHRPAARTARTAGTALVEEAAPPVDVAVLTWRSVEETVRCLQSVLGSKHADLRLFVVDNGSDNGADGEIEAWLRAHRPDVVCLDCGTGPARAALPTEEWGDARTFLLRSSHNRGYSGGMNLALELVERLGGGSYFFLLNNDANVRPDTIAELVRRCEEDHAIGLCGVTQQVRTPDGTLVEEIAGGFRYHPAVGFPRHLHPPVAGAVDRSARDAIEAKLFGVHGAAVFGTASFLQHVGPLGVDRFIYWEEQDWATRARRAGFRVAWAPAAVIDHVNDSSAAHYEHGERAQAGRYLKSRARIAYTKRHHPGALPSVLALQLVHCAVDAVRHSPPVARASMAGVLDGLIGRHRWFPSMGAAMVPQRGRADARVCDAPSHGLSTARSPIPAR